MGFAQNGMSSIRNNRILQKSLRKRGFNKQFSLTNSSFSQSFENQIDLEKSNKKRTASIIKSLLISFGVTIFLLVGTLNFVDKSVTKFMADYGEEVESKESIFGEERTLKESEIEI